jgi:hypothetical protein
MIGKTSMLRLVLALGVVTATAFSGCSWNAHGNANDNHNDKNKDSSTIGVKGQGSPSVGWLGALVALGGVAFYARRKT